MPRLHRPRHRLQFLRELHFIEASIVDYLIESVADGCSSFGSCTSLRLRPYQLVHEEVLVAVPSGAALH